MKKYLALILVALTFVCLFAFGASAAETFVNPVANGADPFVFKDTDGTYYMYITSGGAYGYRVYSSTNLVEWESQGYCLRRDDVYTDDSIVKVTENEDGTFTSSKIYNFWAPEVIKEGDTYYMIYTAQEHIGIATSDSPLGPFTNDATSYLIPYEVTAVAEGSEGTASSTFKCIDGHFFKDEDGKLYLYFVSAGAWNLNGDSVYTGNNIWGGEFDLETLSFVSGPQLLIKYDTLISAGGVVRDPVAEGPEMLKYNGTYYLTYSASGYTDPAYAVHYATSSSPLGTFTKYSGNPIFKSDDADQNDTANPHLYGTAHHCFTTSPDGNEMIIVYHAHRSGSDPNGVGNTVEERRICIDLAWFDDDGVLHAGRNADGVPSATAQALPSGATLTREQNLTGTFADIPNLPTVYVANVDGNDEAAGTKAAPFKTLDAAYAALPNGGTIILTQTYTATSGDYYETPASNGPIMIKGETSAIPFLFKFLSVNSDTYFDNISFWPFTLSNISVIECNFNNVVMGEGVSCISQPTRKTFPVLVGGYWWSASHTTGVYANFQYASTTAVTKDVENTITVLSGTWSIATKYSVKDTSQLTTTAPSSTITIGGDAKIRPAKMAAPTVVASGDGASLTFKAVKYAPQYVIYKDGEVLGYTTDTTYLDTTWSSGETAAYSVAGYVNGACIGDASAATTLDFSADIDLDGDIDVADVVALLSGILNGTKDSTLRDVLVVLKLAVK